MTEVAAEAPHGARDHRAGPSPSPSRPVLALDLGGSRIRAAVVDAAGRVVTRSDGDTPLEDGPAAVVAACIDHLTSARDAAPAAARARITALGISAPGPLDLRRGRMVEPPNLGAAFRDVALTAPLGDAVGVPAVLERDTHVAALAEQAFGAARGATDFIYLTVSTGLGGAIVSGGRLLTGLDGVAGELGHLTVDIDGPLCGCGARGHLEALSSGSGIARIAQEALAGGAHGVLADAVAGSTRLTARHVAEAEMRGDALARAIMERARSAFAAALVGLVNVFNPELIVVGGSLARAQGERLLAPARAAIESDAFSIPRRRVRLVEAQLGDDVGLVGAVPLVASLLPARAARKPETARGRRPDPAVRAAAIAS
jgi:glucokinase